MIMDVYMVIDAYILVHDLQVSLLTKFECALWLFFLHLKKCCALVLSVLCGYFSSPPHALSDNTHADYWMYQQICCTTSVYLLHGPLFL